MEKSKEDEMECDCYIVACVSNNGKFYMDRVYRSIELADKRIEYLNKISQDRAVWTKQYSQLGK